MPSAEQAPRLPFRILALDGGGVRGIFAAALLAGLEDDFGRPIADLFDLVVGTSTGGIIALGLGAGMSPRRILDFYIEKKDLIFRSRLGWRRLRHPFVAKYGSHDLEVAVRSIFGSTTLGESKVPLVVPAYNLGENDVYLFKTPHHARLKRDHKVQMWAVAMATCAAPTYFPAFRLPDDQIRLVDGGVWANNPSMVGVTEAVSMFGQRLEDIRVLSLGTTASARVRRSHLDNGGLIPWVRSPSVIDVLLTGQSKGSFAQVQHLIGPEYAIRLDPPAPDELAKLDECDASALIAKAAHHGRAFSPRFEAVFGSHSPVPYVPHHGRNGKAGRNAHD